MNNSYFYLDIPNWKEMQGQVTLWLENNFFINNKKNFTGYKGIDNKILDELPIIQSTFRQLNFEVKRFALFYKTNYATNRPHCDYGNYEARINFPILNCASTYTAFYSVSDNATRSLVKNHNGHEYYEYSADAIFTEKERCVIDRPTIISVKTLHSVIVPDKLPLPRITATVAVEPDPIFYLT